MRLSRIYVEQSLSIGAKIQLDVPTSHYARNVLRLKTGSSVALFDGESSSNFEATLVFEGKKTFAVAEKQTSGQSESPLASEIIQGLSRSDHLDWMIQKCTELGVSHISIFNAEHTQIPLKPAQRDKKLCHWRAIAIKACEQSGRTMPPGIQFFPTIEQALSSPIERQSKLLLDFDGESMHTHLQRSTHNQLSIMLGPEGGLSTTEIASAHKAGFTSVQLGPRVLRTETAAVTAVALAQSVWGDM